MKRLFLLLSCLSHVVIAQDPLLFDLYQYNTKTINSAFVGLENEQNFDLQYRSDLTDANLGSSALIAYGGKINKINSGVGFIFLTNREGGRTKTKASLLYNYQFNLKTKGKLSLGTELKYQNEAIDASKYYYINAGDPLIVDGSSSTSNFDFDFGVLYQIKNLYIGLSAKNILQSKFDFGIGSSERYNARLLNVYILNHFTLKDWLKVSPSLLFTTDFQGNSNLDLNTYVELVNLILLGTSQRISENESLGAYNIGADIKDKVQIILSFSRSYSETSKNGNMFELMTRIRLSNE